MPVLRRGREGVLELSHWAVRQGACIFKQAAASLPGSCEVQLAAFDWCVGAKPCREYISMLNTHMELDIATLHQSLVLSATSCVALVAAGVVLLQRQVEPHNNRV